VNAVNMNNQTKIVNKHKNKRRFLRTIKIDSGME